ALARVLRGAREVERPALELDAGPERCLERLVDRVLRQPDGDRALRRDRARHALRLVEPRLARDDARNEPGAQRLVRRQEPAGENHVRREGLADGAGQPLGAAGAGHDPEVDLGLAELRGLRRHDQVARHRELATAAEAVAGDRRDERSAQRPDRVPPVDAAVLVEPDRARRGELPPLGAPPGRPPPPPPPHPPPPRPPPPPPPPRP